MVDTSDFLSLSCLFWLEIGLWVVLEELLSNIFKQMTYNQKLL